MTLLFCDPLPQVAKCLNVEKRLKWKVAWGRDISILMHRVSNNINIAKIALIKLNWLNQLTKPEIFFHSQTLF